MGSINNLVIALARQVKFKNVAQARRWFAAHLSDAFLTTYRALFSFLRKPYGYVHGFTKVA
jgi:hypothetical protein